MSEEEEKKKKPKAPVTFRQLTVSQKAEATALWRTGSVTLEELGKKFKKHPETLSRMLKRMGIEKGSGAAEAVKKIIATSEARALTDAEETMKKIANTRDEHFRMAGGLAKLAWAELVRVRQAGIDIASLKDLMVTLKLAGDVIGNARKELFAVLDVEKYSKEQDFENLPELTVRELTDTEIVQLQTPQGDDMGVDEMNTGAEMMHDTPEEGP